MKVSGFTFIHNAVESGYPIVEAISMVHPFVDEIVVVDMQSTDRTVELIKKRFGKDQYVRIIPGVWEPGTAGECLKKAHAQYKECTGDVILHFEADEVYDYRLVQAIHNELKVGHWNLLVPRLQVEQNFQRVRWYPEYVHRVFPNNVGAPYDSGIEKDGHTTKQHKNMEISAWEISPVHGFLWDVTNCFRDNCIQRFKNQAELWGHAPVYRFAPIHSHMDAVAMAEGEAETFLHNRHWTWNSSPFKLPSLLERLVGVTNYGA